MAALLTAASGSAAWCARERARICRVEGGSACSLSPPPQRVCHAAKCDPAARHARFGRVRDHQLLEQRCLDAGSPAAGTRRIREFEDEVISSCLGCGAACRPLAMVGSRPRGMCPISSGLVWSCPHQRASHRPPATTGEGAPIHLGKRPDLVSADERNLRRSDQIDLPGDHPGGQVVQSAGRAPPESTPAGTSRICQVAP